MVFETMVFPQDKDDSLIHGTDQTRMWKGSKTARVVVSLRKHDVKEAYNESR